MDWLWFFLNQITNKYIIIVAENKRGKSNYNLTVYRKINGTVTGTFDSFLIVAKIFNFIDSVEQNHLTLNK